MATKHESDLIFDLLRTRANLVSHPFTWTKELGPFLGRKLDILEFRELLDPIYEEVKLQQGRPDITLTVITDDGYPPYISLGGPVRSVRFDRNNPKHVTGWIAELRQVWAIRW
jgi:hypothetical protein